MSTLQGSRFSQAWDVSKAFTLAVGVHLLAALLIVFGTSDWEPFRTPSLEGLTIEAVMVDTVAMRNAQQEAELAALRKREQERRQQQLDAQREREQQEAEDAEKRRQRELLAQKRQEDLRLQQLRKRQQTERAEKVQRQEDELEKIRRLREEAARQRIKEEERLKQLEAMREHDAAAKRQADVQSELAEQVAREAREFRAGQMATLAQQYAIAIQSQVTNNWLRPPTARGGLRCTLRIVQIPGGEVISANIAGSCNGDEATRRSLVAAVERTGTLPYRGFEDVFQREIDFNFKYDGDQ
ncbi:MAG: colicin import membrane protein [Lysobacterales bacterium]